VLGKSGRASTILDITVAGSSPAKVAAAANRLAALAVRWQRSYGQAVQNKLLSILARDRNNLSAINKRLVIERALRNRLLVTKGVNPTARLLTLINIDTTINNDQASQILFQLDVVARKQGLLFARSFDPPKLISLSSALARGGPTRASRVLVGILIGTLLGLLVAVLREPIRSTLNSSTG
jgi:capsular polysaccharide biosynthesis protein